MRKKVLFFILILLVAVYAFPREDSWGNLKKIYFNVSIHNDEQVLSLLSSINFDRMNRNERNDIARQLIRVGDHYFEGNNFKIAEAFYSKITSLSPQYWYLYNKLEKIRKEKGGFLFNFKYIFLQLGQVLKNFKSSFMLINHFFNILFFTVLFVFFLFAGYLFIRYYKLAANDLLLDSEGHISTKRIIIFLLVLFWPILILSGWMIYPFLVSGFLWKYLHDSEKKAVTYMLIIVGVVTVFFSLNQVMEQSIQSEKFQKAWKVYKGNLFSKDNYQYFDDELKTVQAYFYYESGDSNKTQDILNSTGDEFKNTLKFNLIGNINFKAGDYSQSIENYKQALQIDDHDPIALNNFTVALFKDNKPEAVKMYTERYPEIDSLRSKDLTIKDPVIHDIYLWKRLINSGSAGFSFGDFFSRWLAEFFKIPVIYFVLLFGLYLFFLEKILPGLGESIYCFKCSRIIKESVTHKSYKLCDECHQLFSIKDVIFLEAKILKEKELKQNFRKRYLKGLIFSLLIPGLNFTHRENHRLFLGLAMWFYLLLGFSLVGIINFNGLFPGAPLFFNLVGAVSIILYFLINIASIIGDEDGL